MSSRNRMRIFAGLTALLTAMLASSARGAPINVVTKGGYTFTNFDGPAGTNVVSTNVNGISNKGVVTGVTLDAGMNFVANFAGTPPSALTTSRVPEGRWRSGSTATAPSSAVPGLHAAHQRRVAAPPDAGGGHLGDRVRDQRQGDDRRPVYQRDGGDARLSPERHHLHHDPCPCRAAGHGRWSTPRASTITAWW